MFPLVGQFENGDIMRSDDGATLECETAEDLEEFLSLAATLLEESGQRKMRVFKKPEGTDVVVTASTPVHLCYVGEIPPDGEHTIQWTCHHPNMIS